VQCFKGLLLLWHYSWIQKWVVCSAGAGTGAEAGADAAKLRSVTFKQLLIALHQLSDVIDLKQMKITQKMGGAAAGAAADGDM